jgi:hypothetical protein
VKSNEAVTVVSAFIAMVHAPVPLQPPPDQPVNMELASGVAVNVTSVPVSKTSEQLPPQEITPGPLMIMPVPGPVLMIVSLAFDLNSADTVTAEFIVTVHVPVPLHPPPDQPVNVELESGVAINVTTALSLYTFVQITPHDIPAGVLEIDPDPVPDLVTVSGYPPTPVIANICTGVRASLEKMLSIAFFDPAERGANVILIVHELPAAIVEQLCVGINSPVLAPVMFIAFMTSGAELVFTTATAWAVEFPIFIGPKSIETGTRRIPGCLVLQEVLTVAAGVVGLTLVYWEEIDIS